MTRFRTSTAAAGLGVAALLALTGCASDAVVSPSSTGISATARTVTETGNGSTVHLAVGSTLRLVLHSTTWSVPRSSSTALLAPGSPTTTQSHGPSCRPGSGCGTVSIAFTAVKPGTAQVTADRSNCGEAMRCPPGKSQFHVTVVIGASS